jgi:hypothetical protein
MQRIDSYVIDCEGLAELAQTRSNAVRSAIFDLLESGHILVPTAVWKEFKEAFEDDAVTLAPHIITKTKIKPAHTAATAAIASNANSRFRIDPYGSSDWIAAGVAKAENCTIITVNKKRAFYSNTASCVVRCLSDFP